MVLSSASRNLTKGILLQSLEAKSLAARQVASLLNSGAAASDDLVEVVVTNALTLLQ